MNKEEKFELVCNKKENLLPQEIREGLNEIRRKQLQFYEKAEKLASLLAEKGCEDIEVLDCDVCITDFYPEFFQKLSEIYPTDFDSLTEEEQNAIHSKMKELIPKEAKVRVHAQTSSGYFTWCFGCESTMCGNEVEYLENPNWNKIHKEKAREIISQHPEWKISKFNLSGSTRNRICIDVISQDPEFKYHFFDQDDLHISIHPADSLILRYHPEIEEYFESF